MYYWVLPGFGWAQTSFNGFYLVFQRFIELLHVVLGFALVILGSTEFYWVLPSFPTFHRALTCCTGFYRVLVGLKRVLLGFT